MHRDTDSSAQPAGQPGRIVLRADVCNQKDQAFRKKAAAYQELFSLTRRFLEALPRCRGFANRELRRMTQKVRELLESIDS